MVCRLRPLVLGGIWALVLAGVQSCATYAPKYASPQLLKTTQGEGAVRHQVFLIGDAGLSPLDSMNPALQRFRDRISRASENSTALFLGDNIYPAGMPDPDVDPAGFAEARSHLDAQLNTLGDFAGRPVFIPGNHDWYSDGLKGLKRQEKYVEDYLDRKDVFLPEDGCPLEVEELADDLVLITVDSKWYLARWDRTPSINDDCEIKSREVFLSELESEIKKYADRTILLAVHHPVFSYGEHGGEFTLRQQLYPSKTLGPLPVLGSLANLFRKTGGVSPEDLFNRRYQELRQRLQVMARYGERVLIVSGHEHTLQYIVEDGVTQIVSGAGAKKGATRLRGGSLFSSGSRGYAVLDLMEDGSAGVRFYGVDDAGKEELLFSGTALDPPYYPDPSAFRSQFPDSIRTSVYSQEETDKGRFYRKLWGERYRKYYSREVQVPTVRIDTLYGGLVPVRKGGGQQSKSLRLRHQSGKEYVMRAMRKQAEQNLQAMVFQNQYVMGLLKNTAPENLLEDIYTGAHPYAPYSLDVLMDSLGIYHTNPKLFYVPKQAALGKYNSDFGDELYMIEEHPSEGHERLASFGNTPEIESTRDLLEKLREDEKYSVDTDALIRARLFDMLIGDWDRHQDQWRWATFELKEGDSVVYRPIPRDRDQVFSIMGDGWLGSLLTRLVPDVRKMEGFHEEIRNLRAFNTNPMPLDRVLLSGTEETAWLAQAREIRRVINADLIDRSFEGFPVEVRDSTVLGIKRILLKRLEDLEKTASSYYRILQKDPLLAGTDKDDWFRITGTPGGGVRVEGFRNIDGKPQRQFLDKAYDPSLTKEIWLYGLDDDDRFELDLPENSPIKLRIIGGLGKDLYEVENGKNTVVYDFRSKRSEMSGKVRTVFTDDYKVNTFRPLEPEGLTHLFLPAFGFNPDDGFRFGAGYTLTRMGFRRNPFTERHQLRAGYFLATSGFDLQYAGEFASLFGRWNLEIQARYSSPNFTRNFFGFGNETSNPDDALGLDYNRVRTRILRLAPALRWRGLLGGSFRVGASYEDITVEESTDRFVNTFYLQSGEESSLSFLGAFGEYSYVNRDNAAFPTLGMSANLSFGYTRRLSGESGSFGYVIPSLGLNHPLDSNGNLVLATRWKAHFNIGNGWEFYQGAQIGASDGPRSYRNERFTGKTSYYQITDIRWQFSRRRTGVLPINPGIFGGFDYGRVWLPGEDSSRWHTSYGGGIFINGLDVLSANAALFHGAEGFRFSFGFGFTF